MLCNIHQYTQKKRNRSLTGRFRQRCTSPSYSYCNQPLFSWKDAHTFLLSWIPGILASGGTKHAAATTGPDKQAYAHHTTNSSTYKSCLHRNEGNFCCVANRSEETGLRATHPRLRTTYLTCEWPSTRLVNADYHTKPFANFSLQFNVSKHVHSNVSVDVLVGTALRWQETRSKNSAIGGDYSQRALLSATRCLKFEIASCQVLEVVYTYKSAVKGIRSLVYLCHIVRW